MLVNKSHKKKLYIGIELLRIFFSFNIVLFHCMNKQIYSNKFININRCIVSIGLKVFFILAFYFSYNSFSQKKIMLIKQRFQRLLIPYIIWPIIFYIHKNNFFYLFLYKNKNKLKKLYYQIIIGYGIYTVFWFSYNLMFISLLLTIIIFSTKKNIVIIIVSGIFIYFFSHSSIYDKIFLNYKKIVVFSNKPLASTYILSTIGFYLSSIKFIEKANENKKYYIIFYSTLLILLSLYYKIIKKFGFLSYFFSVYLIILFSILPFHKLIFANIIKHIGSYTGGIYYIHNYVNFIVKKFFFKYNLIRGTIINICINYLICYIICFIGFNIFKKKKLKSLFI